MEGEEFGPHGFRDGQLLFAKGFPDDVDVDALFGREQIAKQFLDIRIRAIGPRERSGPALWIRFDGPAQLLISSRLVSLAKKKIAEAPGNVGRSGIAFPGLQVCPARFLDLP